MFQSSVAQRVRMSQAFNSDGTRVYPAVPHPRFDPIYDDWRHDPNPVEEMRVGDMECGNFDRRVLGETWDFDFLNKMCLLMPPIAPFFMTLTIALLQAFYGPLLDQLSQLSWIGPIFGATLNAPIALVFVGLVCMSMAGWHFAGDFAVKRAWTRVFTVNAQTKFLRTWMPRSSLAHRDDILAEGEYLFEIDAQCGCEDRATCTHPIPKIYERDYLSGLGTADMVRMAEMKKRFWIIQAVKAVGRVWGFFDPKEADTVQKMMLRGLMIAVGIAGIVLLFVDPNA